MKNLLFISAFILFFLQSCSSVNSMQGFYNKYESEATVIPVPQFALKLAGKNSESLEFLQYLKSAKIFVMSSVSANKQQRVMKDLQSSIKGDRYTSFLKINKGSQQINVSVLEQGDQVKSLLLGINGLQNVMVIDSKLDITKAKLEEVFSKIDESEISELKKALSL